MQEPDLETLFDAAMEKFWGQSAWKMRERILPMTCYLAACLVVKEAEQEYTLDEQGYRALIDTIVEESTMVLVEGPPPPFPLPRLGRVVAGSLTCRMLSLGETKFEEMLRKRWIQKTRKQRKRHNPPY